MYSNSDESPDAGETIVYTIVVTNEGTVTLVNVEAISTSGNVNCGDVAQPVAMLHVGASYECTASHLVRAATLHTKQAYNTTTAVASYLSNFQHRCSYCAQNSIIITCVIYSKFDSADNLQTFCSKWILYQGMRMNVELS